MNRILAIAMKEFVHIRREPRLIIAVILMPLLQLFLFSYALSFDVKHVPTAVLDQDRTAASRDFVGSLEHSGFFTVDRRLESISQVDDVFLGNHDRVVVIVAPGFAEKIASGGKGEAAILVDGGEPNSAQLGQSYAKALSRSWGGKVALAWAESRGVDPGAVGQIEPHVRIWYNPEARSSNFLVPGLIVVIIMLVTVQQTATTLVKEKDQGTLEQIIASPVRRGEIVVGKVLPWVAIAALDFIFTSLAAVVVFRVPLRGDVLLFAVASALFVLCCLSLGLLVSSRASSVEVANQTALLLSFLPGFMLSGFVFPLASIPKVLQYVSYIFPARYMVIVTRAVFLKGAGWDVLWPQVAALAVYAAVALTLSSISYQRRLS